MTESHRQQLQELANRLAQSKRDVEAMSSRFQVTVSDVMCLLSEEGKRTLAAVHGDVTDLRAYLIQQGALFGRSIVSILDSLQEQLQAVIRALENDK
ncbi:MAG: hypothetical protein HXY34_01915 [Candidatus Thorarchaeota archaeon]|nr:hypothetical protein [Candidatus Thorarchaeota archaeon]